MRYEFVLQNYWSKGFFFGGVLFYFNKTLEEILSYVTGFRKLFIKRLVQRFELTVLYRDKYTQFIDYKPSAGKAMSAPLNIMFSQINSVNNQYYELYRLNIIRLYLIKSYRGRSHALGKPVRGQRTWSNAWNSFKVNKTLRSYISVMNQQISMNTKVEKINYKVVKKKYASNMSTKKKQKNVKKPKKIWF